MASVKELLQGTSSCLSKMVVESTQKSHGPKPLLDEFEQLTLLQIILKHPGIYLKEIQERLESIFGVRVALCTIC